MKGVKIEERGPFYFITPTSSLDKVGIIEVRKKGEKEFKEVKITKPTILSRYTFELEGGSSLLELPELDLVTAVTSKNIYLSSERKDLFLTMLNHPNKEVIIEINYNDQFLLGMERSLNESGLLHEVLELPDLGQYEIRAKLKNNPEVSARCEFEVAEYTMSPLFAKLEKYNFSKDGQVLKVEDVTLTILDQSYSGKVRVDRYCAYIHCKRVVDSLEVEFVNGKLKEPFEFRWHTGPFTLHFTTNDGSTASAFIEQSQREERETIVLSELGPIIEASLVPVEGVIPTKEIYIQQVGSKTSPFILEEVITSEAKIMATQDTSLVQIVKVSPFNGLPVIQEYKGVKKGDILTMEVDSPFSLLAIGAFLKGKNEPYTGQAVVIKPVEIGLGNESIHFVIFEG